MHHIYEFYRLLAVRVEWMAEISRRGNIRNVAPAAEDVAEVRVRVATRSSRPGVGVKCGDEWQVRVAAPPADNAANLAVTLLLAETAGVGASKVTLAAGARSTHKRFIIRGLTQDQLDARLQKPSENRPEPVG